MSTGNDGGITMSDETRPDTPKDGIVGLDTNKPLGRCPGCTKWVLERDYHFRTTRSETVWHARCAEGILDASSTLVRIVNVYATAVERALLFLNAGRVGQGVRSIEAGTTAVNTLMQDAGVSKMFRVPTRPQPYAVPPAEPLFHFDPTTPEEGSDDDDPEQPA
jgi:hypothetical protein